MMGLHDEQASMFSYNINLDKRVRADHPLRRVAEAIDFTFARTLVAHTYGQNGNRSVDPVVLLKLMFLLFCDDIKSERELMRMLPERLDYLWFLGYGLDDKIPNHSVLSKARKRWGPEVFESLFVQTVEQCVQAGLVDGHKIHMDGSLIDAHASRDSVIKGEPELIARIKEAYGAVERKLDLTKPPSARCDTNTKLVSTTDPDAPCVSRGWGSGTARPRYKHHRAVDDQCGVITAVQTTPGDVTEVSQINALISGHQRTTNVAVEVLVADRGYGTVDAFCNLVEQGIRPHMSRFLPRSHKSQGRFTGDQFRYDQNTDTYVCPAGETLHPRRVHKRRQMVDYVADPKTCEQCALRSQCTKSKLGRSVSRHMRQEALDEAMRQSRTDEAWQDRRRRRPLMEGSFAQSANQHHFKKARWRRLWRQQIQDLLIAAVQNALKLVGTLGKAVSVSHPAGVVVDGGFAGVFMRALRTLIITLRTNLSGLCRSPSPVTSTVTVYAF